MKVFLEIMVEADLPDTNPTPDPAVVASTAKAMVERVIEVTLRGCGLSIKTTATAAPTPARRIGK